MRKFTAWVEWDPETKLYVGIVPGIHMQANSLDALHTNLKEVLKLCLEEMGEVTEDLAIFVGVQQIEVAV